MARHAYTPHTVHPHFRRRSAQLGLAVTVFALALFAAACGSSSSANSSGPATLRITAPAEGATVGRSFEVTFETNRAIGEPSTGLNHVHLYYDGNRTTNQADYDKAYTKSFTVTRLGPGRHTVEAVIANADHSVTNVHTQITVSVSATSPSAPSNTTPSTAGSGPYGY
jgi:hypothetical protein